MYPKIYLTLQSNLNAGKFTSPMDSTVGRRNPAPYVFTEFYVFQGGISSINSMIYCVPTRSAPTSYWGYKL